MADRSRGAAKAAGCLAIASVGSSSEFACRAGQQCPRTCSQGSKAAHHLNHKAMLVCDASQGRPEPERVCAPGSIGLSGPWPGVQMPRRKNCMFTIASCYFVGESRVCPRPLIIRTPSSMSHLERLDRSFEEHVCSRRPNVVGQ